MDRPKNLKGDSLKYIEYLENKLDIFSSKKTSIRAYLAQKKIVDDINNLIMKGIDIEDPETNKLTNVGIISDMSLTNKDDKSFDRIIKVIDKLGDYTESLNKMEKDLSPEEINAEREILKGNHSVESIIFGK